MIGQLYCEQAIFSCSGLLESTVSDFHCQVAITSGWQDTVTQSWLPVLTRFIDLHLCVLSDADISEICGSSAAHKIELLFLMSFTKCDTSTKYDAIAEVIRKNTSILRTMQCTNTGLSPMCCWGHTHSADSASLL